MLKNIMTRFMNTITNINILILGNGAREKIIQDKLISLNSQNVIYILDIDNFESIKEFCINNNIILVIPSTEEYLCKGIVDFLIAELPDIKVFGPTQNQARIEGSKYYSKMLMSELKFQHQNIYILKHTKKELNGIMYGKIYLEIIVFQL